MSDETEIRRLIDSAFTPQPRRLASRAWGPGVEDVCAGCHLTIRRVRWKARGHNDKWRAVCADCVTAMAERAEPE